MERFCEETGNDFSKAGSIGKRFQTSQEHPSLVPWDIPLLLCLRRSCGCFLALILCVKV